jgi:hypothetical protein
MGPWRDVKACKDYYEEALVPSATHQNSRSSET